MLVLSRLPNESVVVTLPDGRRATVMVTRVHGDRVHLGFDFPLDCQVHRAEVQEQIDGPLRRAVNESRRRRLGDNL